MLRRPTLDAPYFFHCSLVGPAPTSMQTLGPIAALLRAGVQPRQVRRELKQLSSHFLTPRVWKIWG